MAPSRLSRSLAFGAPATKPSKLAPTATPSRSPGSRPRNLPTMLAAGAGTPGPLLASGGASCWRGLECPGDPTLLGPPSATPHASPDRRSIVRSITRRSKRIMTLPPVPLHFLTISRPKCTGVWSQPRGNIWPFTGKSTRGDSATRFSGGYGDDYRRVTLGPPAWGRITR